MLKDDLADAEEISGSGNAEDRMDDGASGSNA